MSCWDPDPGASSHKAKGPLPIPKVARMEKSWSWFGRNKGLRCLKSRSEFWWQWGAAVKTLYNQTPVVITQDHTFFCTICSQEVPSPTLITLVFVFGHRSKCNVPVVKTAHLPRRITKWCWLASFGAGDTWLTAASSSKYCRCWTYRAMGYVFTVALHRRHPTVIVLHNLALKASCPAVQEIRGQTHKQTHTHTHTTQG
jgi:hypothetical protein